MTAAIPVLELRDVRVRFNRNGYSVPAVNGVSYRLHASRSLAIIGESGSGKTVSCRALMGLLPDHAAVTGSALLNGRELIGLSEREMRRHRGAGIAMVFQDAARALNPTMRVGYQITEALRQHQRTDRNAARGKAIELLELLRVPAAQQRFLAYPHELSGGLRQRVMIAIAAAGRPQVLIADEATRSLDAITETDTLALLKSLQQQFGTAVVMISHDLRLASSFADDVLVMYAGCVVEYAPAQRLFRNPRMPYTNALLQAIPRLDRPRLQVPFVHGQPGKSVAQMTGCPFEPRCPSALPTCKASRPPFEEHEHGHWWACWNPCIT